MTNESPTVSDSSAPHRVTMKDVAERCGVSLSTVSLVLSGDSRIPAPTTNRVLEVVKALGYRPNVIARSLAKQQNKTVGVVIPDPGAVTDPDFITQALEGVTAETSRQGYRLLLEVAAPQFISRRFYVRLLKENSVDGLIYLGASLRDDFLRDIDPFNYHFLLLGGYLDGIQLSYVTADHEQGGYLAAKHLLGLGHERVGVLTGPVEHSAARDHARGVRRALEEAGRTLDPALVIDGRYRLEPALAAARQLLEKGATAVAAASDAMAAAVLRVAKDTGRRVPDDVAVTGLGDADWARLVDPPLTSVKLDIFNLAAQGTRRLLQRIERGELKDVFQERFPVNLAARASTQNGARREKKG